MGVLVEDLLLLARVDQASLDGGRPFERAPVDLGRLAADAVADARAVAPDRAIEFTVTGVEPQAPVVVLGDELRLRQVAANLLSNALTHTPPGAAVRVSVAAVGDLARLEVADDGPGLPPEVADRVFERFYRADKARSRATGGTGLGLSIVAAIAEGHGGSARLEPSAADRPGATFVVELPLHAPSDDPEIPPEPSPQEWARPKIG